MVTATRTFSRIDPATGVIDWSIPAPTLDQMHAWCALASRGTPLYIEWRRETTTSDRPVEAGTRKIVPSDIITVEVVIDRENHARADRRDRRGGRKDFRYWVTASMVAYKNGPKNGNTHYLNGWANPRLADCK